MGRYQELVLRTGGKGGNAYLSGFGQLKLDLLEGERSPFGLEKGDFVVFGQLQRHF